MQRALVFVSWYLWCPSSIVSRQAYRGVMTHLESQEEGCRSVRLSCFVVFVFWWHTQEQSNWSATVCCRPLSQWLLSTGSTPTAARLAWALPYNIHNYVQTHSSARAQSPPKKPERENGKICLTSCKRKTRRWPFRAAAKWRTPPLPPSIVTSCLYLMSLPP